MSSLRVTNRRREAGRPMPGLVTMYADAAVSKKTTVKSIFTTEKYLHFMFPLISCGDSYDAFLFVCGEFGVPHIKENPREDQNLDTALKISKF